MIFILNHPKYFLESKSNSLLSNEDPLMSQAKYLVVRNFIVKKNIWTFDIHDFHLKPSKILP